MNYYARIDSPLGPITMAGDGNALTGLWFDGQRYDRAGMAPDARNVPLPLFRETAEWLAGYFAQNPPVQLPPLAPRGTDFQRRVWRALGELPWGTVCTYGELAARLGIPRAARAVGAAVGRNPISLLIPCHRVLGTGGALTGYAGGLERKAWLLRHEGILPDLPEDRRTSGAVSIAFSPEL